MRRNLLGILAFGWALLRLSPASAVPTITSPPPANGISPSAPIVFTFSEPMNPSLTEVTFQSFTPPTTIEDEPTTAVWSGGNTVLTCTPTPAFPANTLIIWNAYGENPAGDFLEGTTDGVFTTGGGGGSGTNSITTFGIGKVHHYNQTNSGAPILDPVTPYNFVAETTLSSNRTATSVVLTLPTASMTSLMPSFSQPEIYLFGDFATSLSTLDATYPPGNYSFLVTAVSSNQTVVVNLPTTNSLPQPGGAPHLTNYPAAQAVNPSQAFALGWDAFPGGTAADYVFVRIGTKYSSPYPGLPGALAGTARTWTIPAGTLQPNTTYDSTIGFYHNFGATNAYYATNAYRATFTDFTLITTSGGATGGPLVLTNASWTSGVFSFDVLSTNGQIVTVEYTTNILSAGPWPKLVTATNTGTPPHIVSPQAATNNVLFYRARNGP